MAGRFHHGMRAAVFSHGAQQAVDFRGFRGRLSQKVLLRTVAHIELNCSQESGFYSVECEQLLNEIAGGAFSIGPGDTNDGHIGGWIVVKAAGYGRHENAAVFYPDVGYFLCVFGQGIAVHNCRGTLFNRRFNIGMAVGVKALQGKKKAAPFYIAAVVGEAADVRVGGTMLFDNIDFC